MEQQLRSRPLALSIARLAVDALVGCVALGLLASSAGCVVASHASPRVSSKATPAAESTPEERPMAYLPPVKLATTEDAIVRILSDVTCTGTLVAEDLVLTAHHCVAARDAQGHVTGADLDPAEISIELGGDYLPWGDVQVRAIISPDCGYRSGDGDIAILVLKRKLIGISTLIPRLLDAPHAPEGDKHGETVTPYGFGRCAQSRDAIHRIRRQGGMIEAVNVGEFVATASICPGDSGGPALSDKSGEILGVISSSMMDSDENTTAASFFTRLDKWRQLFSAAQEISNGASPSELPPYRSCAR